MLQIFRNSSRNWFGKALTTLLFSLLIFSFAIWGVADWIINPVSNTIAIIGDRDITAQEMRDAYNNHIQSLQRQLRTTISPEQAQALGLDRQVLGQLVGQAVLDSSTDTLRLAVPDETIVSIVMREPQFRDSNGRFNRAAFDAALQNAGITEKSFVAEQRAVLPRRQIAESIAGDLAPTSHMQEAFHRYGAERRSAIYATLTPTAAGTIADPDDATLEAWFNERKPLFRMPEFRALTILAIDPETLAKPENVTPEAALARYEADKTTRYGTPETRHLQQLVFNNEAEAAQAHQRLTTADPKEVGAVFEAIAAERKTAAADYDLGLVARNAVFDAAVADAAFALTEPGISAPVSGRFGSVIVRVVSITPPSLQTFSEVEQTVRLAIAAESAHAAINALHDRIEDSRSAMKSLTDIAAENGLKLETAPAIDRTGRNRDGQPVGDLPDAEALIAAAFASDVGADNAPLRQATSTGTGYVWFDVTDVTPDRDRTFAEAHEDALTRWRTEAMADKLASVAGELTAKLDAGETFAAVVASLPKGSFASAPLTATDITRNGQTDGLPSIAVQQIFATHKGKAGSVATPEGRLIFQVTGVTVPAFVTSTEQAGMIAQQLRTAIADDLLSEYITKRQHELRPTVNEEALRAAISGSRG
ncbi:SurA N-terminal domain-containing protein [Pseudochelatococcus sp. G4_1912]|uniref:peptidylprolyl isomerase n=1 Tax=Pseudochelatococcus sp. G4_1912 TaxID=3114288 RepID=UPI0039C72BE0